MTNISHVFQRMKDTPQSPVHHPEGNVFIHTALVYDNAHFSFRSNPIMTIAALFHDTGKPATFKIKDGRITAYGHETVSEDLFRMYAPVLFPNFSQYQLEGVAYIIRNHMRVKKIGEMRPAKVRAMEDEAIAIAKLDSNGHDEDKENLFYALKNFTLSDHMNGDMAIRRFNSPHFDNDLVKQSVARLEYVVRYLQSRVNVHNITEANRVKAGSSGNEGSREGS